VRADRREGLRQVKNVVTSVGDDDESVLTISYTPFDGEVTDTNHVVRDDTIVDRWHFNSAV
jgi:hypothetical protein